METQSFGFINDKRIFIFVGNFGSGKTEIAINFALYLSTFRKNVAIADLDIVNPYFRCREAAKELESKGVKVVIPIREYFWADLPIILPQLKGIIQNSENSVVLDVGGDDLGAKVLSSFLDIFQTVSYELMFVINGNRPFTSDLNGCKNMILEIENSSRLKVTGIISNTHLMNDTTQDIIYKGYILSEALSMELKIPIRFISFEKKILNFVDQSKFKSPVFPIERFMSPPWEGGNFQNIMKRKRLNVSGNNK